MSHSTTIQTLHVPTPAMPRGSSIAAALYAALAALFERRPPSRAKLLKEAASVRALAASMQDSDPGFAADLRAAADRHEALLER
ncbi:MAG: hypothetical protein LCI02_28030 [Proteobacteria bacterium]|nr:hypothetical protein [Pseudomonadota bacterium]